MKVKVRMFTLPTWNNTDSQSEKQWCCVI